MLACSNGHVNPNHTKFCETCGVVILDSSATAIPRAGLTSDELHAQAQQSSPRILEDDALTSSSSNPFAKLTDPNRPNWLIPVVAISAVLILIGGFFAVKAITKAKPVTASVSMTLYGEDDCNISWGYMDVPGSAVTIEADGVPVGFGSLSRYGTSGLLGCTFKTTVGNIPSDAAIYSVTVGRRGTITNSQYELKSNNWEFDLSLGS